METSELTPQQRASRRDRWTREQAQQVQYWQQANAAARAQAEAAKVRAGNGTRKYTRAEIADPVFFRQNEKDILQAVRDGRISE